MQLDFLVSKAICEMIIDDTDGLESCIYCRRSDELKTSLFEIFGDPIRECRSGLVVVHRYEMIIDDFPISKSPNIGIKRSEF